MSATIETIITCDGDSPACEGNDWSADSRFKSAWAQRRMAKSSRGWKYDLGKDYCPACWKKLIQSTESAKVNDLQ